MEADMPSMPDMEQCCLFHPADTGTCDLPPDWKGDTDVSPAYNDPFAQGLCAYTGWEQFPTDAANGCSVEASWQQATPTVIYDYWQGGDQVDTWSLDKAQMLGYPYPTTYTGDSMETVCLHGQESATVPFPLLLPIPVKPSQPREKQLRPKRKRQGSDDNTIDDYGEDIDINNGETGKGEKLSPGPTTSPASIDEITTPLDRADGGPNSMTSQIRDEIARGKNRLSTRKCRTRKRIEASNLTSNEQTLEDINVSLTNCANQLAEEVRSLKMQLLQHADCDSKMIQDYIKLEAERIVQRSWGRKSYSVTMSPCDGFVGGLSPGVDWTSM